MSAKARLVSKAVLGSAVLGAGAYLGYVGVTWRRYGVRDRRPLRISEKDELLDGFMPDCDVRDRHEIQVHASAEDTMLAALEMDWSSPIINALFRARELVLGGEPPAKVKLPKELVAGMTQIGWEVLAQIPGDEIVLGAVTQPWVSNPEFRRIPAEEFEAFNEPGFVKIIWSIRADTLAPSWTLLSTETRSKATDASARARFRPYWAFLSPGIKLIRLILLRNVKRKAEEGLSSIPSGIPIEARKSS